MIYKGYAIEHNLYGMGEYTVQYQGDDVVFQDEKEAKGFVDFIIGVKNRTQSIPGWCENSLPLHHKKGEDNAVSA